VRLDAGEPTTTCALGGSARAKPRWYHPTLFWAAFSLLGCLAVAGCDRAAATQTAQAPPAPEVEVAMPVYQEITDHEDFTGQSEAVKTIDIRARVTGYLKTVHFRHGAEVEKGDHLFDIDPPYYEAEHARAEGVLAQTEARLKRLKLDYARAEKNHSTRVITQAEFDQWSGD